MESRAKQLELERELASLQLAISRANSSDIADIPKIISRLESKKYVINQKTITLRDVFEVWAPTIATSSTRSFLERVLLENLGVQIDFMDTWQVSEYSNIRGYELLGPLVIQDLVHIEPPTPEITDDDYYLTDLGKKVAQAIIN